MCMCTYVKKYIRNKVTQTTSLVRMQPMSYSFSFSFNSFKLWSAVLSAGVWILENQVHQTKPLRKPQAHCLSPESPFALHYCVMHPKRFIISTQIPIVDHIKLQCSGCVRQNVQVYSKTLPIIEFDDSTIASGRMFQSPHKSDTPYLYPTGSMYGIFTNITNKSTKSR